MKTTVLKKKGIQYCSEIEWKKIKIKWIMIKKEEEEINKKQEMEQKRKENNSKILLVFGTTGNKDYCDQDDEVDQDDEDDEYYEDIDGEEVDQSVLV
ncbi:MAG: hypothetical protein EZS28_001605 [Streblomastix strix]|uniref:Uncharacterized protein n=1 Tax=Streblomastix strix TaxID=222440 RepID=A0A5J4X7Z3_9EUKA|nr:MAG: hypothetical protein EZS28_001605 [Streblomastix strix]